VKPWALPVVLALIACSERTQEPERDTNMLLIVDTDKSVAQVKEDLPGCCETQKFGVLGLHDLKAKLIEKGQEFDRECLVFEVCNPVQAKRVLDAHPEISTALPCRISVYARDDGGARLATIRPTQMIGLFGSAELRQVALEVEEAMQAIMEAAAK
jgi:uncharacterized protein (DUF302 family)